MPSSNPPCDGHEPSAGPRPPVLLRAARMLDVDNGKIVEPGEVLVHGEHIAEVGRPAQLPEGTVVHDLGDVTLLPGLMDMEVNLFSAAPTTVAR